MPRYEVAADFFPREAALEERQFDVVIVGAGIAGALIAYELVKAGKSVLMLEAGPDQISIKDRNLYVENFYKASQRVPESAYPDVPAAPKASTFDTYMDPYDGYLDQRASERQPIPEADRNNWFKSTYERRVGGTTWHWLGTCLRLVPNDFHMKSAFDPPGAGWSDWPISYEDLATWYDKAADEMGISGDSNFLFGIPRHGDPCPPEYRDYAPARYPMPKILQSYSDDRVASAVDGTRVTVGEVGIDGCMVVSPTPQARNSMPGYQGRPQCCGNSSCIPVCPIQAKYDATVHIELCRRQYGKFFTLVSQACAHRFEVDSDGKVSRVVYRKWQQEGVDIQYHDYTASGVIFVGAAHAIETPKLLLNSKSERVPNGVANSSGRVGKYLMDHNTQLSYAVIKEPVFSYRGPLSTSGIESLKDNPQRGQAGAFRVEIGNDGWEWPDDAPYQTVFDLVDGLTGSGTVDLGGGPMRIHETGGLFGNQLREAVREISIRQIRLAALVEPTPMLSHYVDVSTHLDALGLPRPKVEYGITDDPYCIQGMENAIQVHQKIFELIGAVPGQIHHKPIDQFAGAGHIMGTYRMGNERATSVTDREQRSWDHENLFLVGSGLFPTVGASNPTFTIGALSLWAADTIKRQLG